MLLYAGPQIFLPGKMSDWVSKILFAGELKQYTHLLSIDALLNLRFDIFWDAMRHMIMPILTLSYITWATYVRVTRSSMLETLRMDYVTTARAKGLSEKNVINQHAGQTHASYRDYGWLQHCGSAGRCCDYRNGLYYPGIGKAAAVAAANLDVVTVLGLAIFSGAILIVSNLIVDVVYAFIDPRVRLA